MFSLSFSVTNRTQCFRVYLYAEPKPMTDQHQKLIKLQRCIFTCQRFSLLLKTELGNLINVYVNNTDLDLLQNSGSLINAYTVYSLDTAKLRLRYFGK